MKKFYSLLIVSFFLCAIQAGEKKKTICLNMIIKDETNVICRCLKSVLPIIDYWVISDTGSTDGTQKMVKEFLKDIPGELYEEPWVNFEYNRNHALDLARNKADYILFIDADEELVFEKDFKLPPLEKDFYFINSRYGGSEYVRSQLVKNGLNWKWKGVVHEAVYSHQARSSEILEKVYNFIRPEQGSRARDKDRYLKDAQALEEALKKNPNNKRDLFYLAQSYKDAGKFELSIKNYEKRIALGGWDQEVFWSKYQIATLQKRLKKDPKLFIDSFINAFTYRPQRAEPLYCLAEYYRITGKMEEAYMISTLALKVPYPKDLLFVEKWIYDYGLLIEQSVSAYWLGKYAVALKGCIKILEQKNLPKHVRKRVLENMKYTQQKINENIQKKAQANTVN